MAGPSHESAAGPGQGVAGGRHGRGAPHTPRAPLCCVRACLRGHAFQARLTAEDTDCQKPGSSPHPSGSHGSHVGGASSGGGCQPAPLSPNAPQGYSYPERGCLWGPAHRSAPSPAGLQQQCLAWPPCSGTPPPSSFRTAPPLAQTPQGLDAPLGYHARCLLLCRLAPACGSSSTSSLEGLSSPVPLPGMPFPRLNPDSCHLPQRLSLAPDVR